MQATGEKTDQTDYLEGIIKISGQSELITDNQNWSFIVGLIGG